ncbi:IclR family transcriptional regulator domain-containing protein [Novosphingobium humi]|uniref:IclR family transcriptional regulator C-terminal domain-containing protein n=1 Tax=Novosphingobium humi TaxID=2282397 RepID=A0ABY7U225_9SPHN|nr:IclR family transcriptional regulator C-terminal domain-containing protein [Novosphingobium humi]WCT79567.1 IclR family transcriptional regulator C-terminal domain-containing protein [Novosphingobium humi]WJT00442.1 helix-turn-helix domain-containing protein [Novosphingobium humi]
MSQSDPDFMQSLARGLMVMEAFVELGPDQSIASLARHTGLPRGVVARCLHTLVMTGYVAQDERSFSVRPKVLGLARAYLSDRSLSAIAQPLLENLRDRLGESCSLGVLDGADVLYVARASQSRIMAIGLHVGSRLPAWCTSMGRILLASLPPEQRDALLPPASLPARTPHTVGSLEDLRALLDRIARDGVAIVDQELEVGLRSVAVPVRNAKGQVIAALNVGVNAMEHSVEHLRSNIAPALIETARMVGLASASGL